MGFKHLVRDQEVDGSNPFAPTTSFRINDLYHTIVTRKSKERLVRGQEVDGPNPFAPIIISPLDSILYKRRIAFRLLARICVQQVQLRGFGRKVKPSCPV
jgi:hypothetical protein